jgi:molecular chaperone DnaK
VSDPIVGIDLGTTNSVVARADDSGARILTDRDNYKIQPSVVAFHPNGSVLVGAGAKQRRVIDPQNTVYSAKRLIGRTFSSPQVTAARARMPFSIKEGENDKPVIVTRAGEFAVPEISAIILDHMRTIAREQLEGEIGRAVVTVPANFTDAQRSATATAGAIAGITVVRVLNEPTAAALAYGHNRDLNQIIAVYDFGGGTFDITLLRLHDQVYQVLGTAGDSFLGGDDIDERLVELMARSFLEQHRVDLTTDTAALMRLRQVAEQTKIQLSRRSRAIIKVDEIAYGPGGAPLNLETEISRDQLTSAAQDIIERSFPVCQEAIRLAGVRPQDVDDVILVGGTTKMPYVRQRVAEFFGRSPRTDINPDVAVAMGAGLQARALEVLLDKGERRSTTQRPAPPPPPAPPAIPEPTSTTGSGAAALADAAAAAVGAAITFGDGASEDTSARKYDRRRTQPGLGATAPPSPPSPSTERSAAPGQFRDELTPPVADPTDVDRGPALARIRTSSPPPVPTSRPAATTLMGAPAPGFDDGDTNIPTEVRGSAPQNLPSGPSAPTAMGLPRPRTDDLPQLADDAPTFPGHRADAVTAMDMGASLGAPTIEDVTPHTLGIATVGGFCEGLIGRNSRVPTNVVKTFSTSRDMQDTVRIRVCQGESRRLDENLILGDLVLEGLELRPRGQTKIEVTFDIDASGILNVTARDPRTGIQQQARLQVLGAQSPEQIAAARDRLREIRH